MLRLVVAKDTQVQKTRKCTNSPYKVGFSQHMLGPFHRYTHAFDIKSPPATFSDENCVQLIVEVNLVISRPVSKSFH